MRLALRTGWCAGRCRADYNEWGEITYKEALDITSSYRRIWPQLSYSGHDWDDVLGMYYAKARFYSADDKRFVAMDPIKGSIVEPMSLVPYFYCVDNPLRWVDILGLASGDLYINGVKVDYIYQNGESYVSMKDLMRAMGGSFCSMSAELHSQELPNGDMVYYEVDTSPIYHAELRRRTWDIDSPEYGSARVTESFVWEVNKDELHSNEVTKISAWLTYGPFEGRKIGINARPSFNFIKFKRADEDIIGIDINQFIKWYHDKFNRVPSIEFEVGEGGVWNRDYRPTELSYAIYVLTGGRDPYQAFSPTGIESVAIIPKEKFRDYYNSIECGENAGLGWFIKDSTGDTFIYDAIFNILNRSQDKIKMNRYLQDDNIGYISISKQIGTDIIYTSESNYLSIKSSHYSQYVLQPVGKGDAMYTVDPVRNGMRIGTWTPISSK